MAQQVEGAIMVEGVYLPAKEKHLIDWMCHGKKAVRREGKITYQWGKQEAALSAAKAGGFLGRGMIDVGAHCALWSMWWAPVVKTIYAFEPIPLYRRIYEAQMALNRADNYVLVPYAVSDKAGQRLEMRVDPENTGGTRAYAPGEKHDVDLVYAETTTLDAQVYEMPVGILKIDCEGYEEKVIRGARNTIQRWKPLIVVEQKFENRHYGFTRKGAVAALIELGYVQHSEIGGDHIMVPG